MNAGKERKKESSKERKRETSNTNSNSNSKYLSACISALAALTLINYILLVFSISFSRRLAPYSSISSTTPISLMNSHQGTKTQKNNYNNKKIFEPSCLSGKNK